MNTREVLSDETKANLMLVSIIILFIVCTLVAFLCTDGRNFRKQCCRNHKKWEIDENHVHWDVKQHGNIGRSDRM